jgi:hypothetical protein
MVLISISLVPAQSNSRAKIRITRIPAYSVIGGPDQVGLIKGTATGISDCQDCRVVLFARTNQWWVQPSADAPYTPIVNGNWQSETHLGAEYAAVLARPSYKASPTVESLPTLGGNILAIDIKQGKR